MRVLIIGSGLIGLTTAFALRRRNHEVVVVDRRIGPALETSFANGGLLTPSMPEPWNSPGSWRTLLKSIGRSDSSLQLRLRTIPSIASWGLEFLRNSAASAYEGNTLKNLRLALASMEILDQIRQRESVSYFNSRTGALRIFRDADSLATAIESAQFLRRHGLSFQALKQTEIFAREPALRPLGNVLVGGIYYPQDEVGDAYGFAEGLQTLLARSAVEFRFQSEVQSLVSDGSRIIGAQLSDETLNADAFVVAAGSYSSCLLDKIGISIPVQPVKGYSITVPCTPMVLSTPIIDDALHAVVTPLADNIRVAGTAEFAGFDTSLSTKRLDNLVSLLERVLPAGRFDLASATPWCGLRPTSADGVPFIGRTHLSNLWVNTGHGHLGWTTAAGSGELIAQIIGGERPIVEPSDYALGRFQSVRRGQCLS